MQIEKYKIENHNESLLKAHRSKFEYSNATIENAESIVKKLNY